MGDTPRPFFRMLGPLEAERGGVPVRPGPPQAAALLALLLLRPGEVISTERLADHLWNGDPPPNSRVQLHGLLSGLRRRLGNGVIVTRAPGYLLDLRPGERDLDLFHRHVAAARALVEAGQVASGATRLRAALALWRGEPFADVTLPAVRQAADHLRELRLGTLEERFEAELALGRPGPPVQELAELVSLHPFRERLRGQLMTALARAGRVPEALEVYRTGRRLLVEEMGLEPSPALRELHEGILHAAPGLRPQALRGLQEAIPHPAPGLRPYEGALPANPRPRPQAVRRRAAVPDRLPRDLPDFVGRAALLARLGSTLPAARGAPPVLAISGMGGIGKSAFAVRLANRLRHAYPGGRLYVSLRGTSAQPLAPAAALVRFLRALGVPAGALPKSVDERAELYRDLVGGRRVLVLLDDAADEAQVRPLLPADPRCAVLVTGRRRLAGLDGARPVPLGVLDLRESLTLLREVVGAARVGAEPEAAARLVAYCGGLPLALRVVAARLRHRPGLRLEDLARWLGGDLLGRLELGDVSVRARLTLSYRRLDTDHQRYFRQLGLLSAPAFDGPTAAALLRTDPGTAERLLDELVEASLVEPAGPGRYALHPLIHLLATEYAAKYEYVAKTEPAPKDVRYPRPEFARLCPPRDSPVHPIVALLSPSMK